MNSLVTSNTSMRGRETSEKAAAALLCLHRCHANSLASKHYLENTINIQPKVLHTMAKSDKKVKSDRINALRKQYDAFLEEDKRRKERNDYILGRLDNMRYCTTMVPVRHKYNVFIDRKDIVDSSLCQPVHTSSLSHTLSVDAPRKPNDDTFVLQEISKKYILIPKTRPTSDVNVNLPPIRPSFEDNTDWKSKYDILEQLKRDEKESDIPACTNKYENNKTNPSQEEDKILDISVHPNKVKPLTEPYKYEVPERDKNADIVYELQEQARINVQDEEYEPHAYPDTATGHQNDKKDMSVEGPELVYNLSDNNFESNNNNEQIVSTQVNDHRELPSDLEFKSSASEEPVYETGSNYKNENINETDYPEQDNLGIYDDQYIPVEEEKDNVTDTEKYINVEENEMKPIAVISSNEIDANMLVQDNQELQENLEYPETIDAQEYTHAGDVELQNAVNMNPETYHSQENYNSAYQFDPSSQYASEHTNEPVDMTGIEAFETEQKEMFYSEDVDQSYPYDQNVTVEGAYDQDSTVQSSYPQHEEAVYYEGAEIEQDYPTGIDEHAEATQRYDPNYEEQYGAAYTQQYQEEGYEQQEFSQQPQYEPEIADQAQQGIEQLQFEEQPLQQTETAEYVQQQLDSEQGFGELQKENMSEIETPIEKLQTGEAPVNP